MNKTEKLSVIICAALLLFWTPSAHSETEPSYILAKVIHINDGDTITIETDKGKRSRIQLAYIDAPDMDSKTGEAQPFHRESNRALLKLLKGKEVVVLSYGSDKFNRIEGIVYLDRLNVNLELIKRGLAEIYHPVRVNPQKYDKLHVKEFENAEKRAKLAKKGVWGLSDYISPYQFRRRDKNP